MAKQEQQTWTAKVNERERTFTLDIIPSGKEAGFTLSADGAHLLNYPTKAPKKWLAAFIGYDVPFQLEGKDLRLVIPASMQNVDIAADGFYLNSGKKYVPLPKWIWAFLAPILLLIITGGFIGAIFGLLGFSVCQKVAKSSLNVIIRIIICIGVMVIAWLLYSGLTLLFHGILKR
jgi:hypothetical protein